MIPTTPLALLTLALTLAPLGPAQHVTWTRLTIPGPAARTNAAMTFDEARQEFVLFGGRGASGVLGDTWVFRNGAWSQLSPSPAPPPREGCTLVFDPARGVSVLFGGTDTSQYFRDTWEWTGSRWIPYPFANSPRARAFHCSCYDPTTSGVLVHGGVDQPHLGTTARVRDTWTWDGAAWAASTFTSYSAFSAAMFSPWDDAVLVDGGLDLNSSTNILALRSYWIRGGTSLGHTTYSYSGMRHALVADRRYSGLLKIGGYRSAIPAAGGSQPALDTVQILRFGGSAFEDLPLATPGPNATIAAAVSSDPATRDILVFGGEDSGGTLSGETWLVRVNPLSGSTRVFGTGCPVSSPFTLSPVTTDPQIGGSVAVQLSSFYVLPATFAVSLGVSDQSIGGFPLPLSLDPFGMTGCFVYHSFEDPGVPFSTSTPSVQWSTSIPNIRSLIGVSVYLQAVAIAAGANPLGVVTSNAIEVVFGG